jgi:hypothetical protein
LSLGDPIEVYRFVPRFLRTRCLYHAEVLESSSLMSIRHRAMFSRPRVARQRTEADTARHVQGMSAFLLEEIAASASISFEQAWYSVPELLQLRFLTPSGLDSMH